MSHVPPPNSGVDPSNESTHDQDHISPTKMSSQFIRFLKAATTDIIVNTDPDLIDVNSFQYVNKDSVVKALVYMLKDAKQRVISETKDSDCQCDESKTLSSNGNQVESLSLILKDFQNTLLKSVDDKLSAVDNKISDAIAQISNDNHIKSFSETASKVTENVENLAKSTISNVESIAKHSIDIVNSKTSGIPQFADIVAGQCSTSDAKSCQVFVSHATVLNAQESINSDVMVLNPVNPHTAYVESKLGSIKNSLRTKLKKVPFEVANDKSKTGNIALRFPNEKAYTEAEKLIDTSFLSSINYESKKAKKMLPKITLKGVPGYLVRNVNVSNLDSSQNFDAKKQELTTQLRDKNPCIDSLVSAGHTFQIVFISNNSNSDELTLGIKVSPLIRSTILSEQNGYVFIGSKRCMFNDRFNIGQCYHCQHLGHTSPNCPNKNENPTCLYCMESHRSNVCTVKNHVDKQCCAKCHNSSVSSDVDSYRSHNSASPDCPVYIRECQRLANVTDFSSKNIL